MESQPFVLERTYDVPISKLWKAITDEDDMKQWYFDLPGFSLHVGYEFEFEGGPTPERQYLHKCRIIEVIHERRISYSWSYEGYPGDSMVTFDLTPVNGKTKLRFTHEGLETFPKSNPDLATENFVTGWTYFLDTAIKAFLQGKKESENVR